MNVDELKNLSEEEFNALLDELGQKKAEELLYTWEFWARPDQLEPKGDWFIWFNNSGRGAGKTRSGAEWVRHRIKCGDKRIACVAPTRGDVRRVLVEGESGFLNICWKNDRTYRGAFMGYPEWSPTNNTLKWANGAKVEFFSAEDPERLRGPQFHAAWCDEMAAWNNLEEVWNMLQLCLRLGKRPRVYITTTPKPKKLIRQLYRRAIDPNDTEVVYSSVSSYANAGNINLKALTQYEGTRLGRQELHAEILEEASGALWTMQMLEDAQILYTDVPRIDPEKRELKGNLDLHQIVVSVDPATTTNEESDMTGIVVAGRDVNGICYILEDATFQGTPSQWAKKAMELYEEYEANCIVYETNQGGDMVRHTLQVAAEEYFGNPDSVALRPVHASRGKFARAEPVSALYEQGKVKHVPGLDELERQMVTWEPLSRVGSPDRLDAMVWAVTKLMLAGVARPNLKLVYSAKEEANV